MLSAIEFKCIHKREHWNRNVCLKCFVFSFQKLSRAGELSVSVITFDMNAIPVCNLMRLSCCPLFRLSGKLPFTENDPAETEARIQAAKFDLSKLYQNVSQSASLFIKKILCSYPWWVKQRIVIYSSETCKGSRLGHIVWPSVIL